MITKKINCEVKADRKEAISVSDLEKFIYETRDDSNEFECEGDEAVAFGINQAMDALSRLIESKQLKTEEQ